MYLAWLNKGEDIADDVIVLAARPFMGKSTMAASELAASNIKLYDKKLTLNSIKAECKKLKIKEVLVIVKFKTDNLLCLDKT